MVLDDDDLEVGPELYRTLEGLLAWPLIEGVAKVLHPLPVDKGGEGEGLPVPHHLPGPPGLKEGGVHLLPPVDVVAHAVAVQPRLGEAVGPDRLDGPPQEPVHRRSFGLEGAEWAGGVARENYTVQSLNLGGRGSHGHRQLGSHSIPRDRRLDEVVFFSIHPGGGDRSHVTRELEEVVVLTIKPGDEWSEEPKRWLAIYSKHEPSGPMLSISQNIRTCVRLCVHF